MAHPFQQRKLLITVCKAEIGWDQPDSSALQSGYVTLVAGPYRASTRSVPATRKNRPGAPASSTGPSACLGPAPARGQQLSWAPSLGPELFVLTEDCLLVADLVVGAELWGQKSGGRWNSSAETLYAQSEICLDAEGQALLLSGRCLEVRLPLMQPQGQGGAGKGKGGGAGSASGGGRAAAASGGAVASAAPPPPVLGVLALSMLLQPADAEAAAAQHLPPELVPRLVLDTTRLLPGAVVRGAAGVAYVEPCVMFLRVRLISATGLGRGGGKDASGQSRSSTPAHLHHHVHHAHHQHGEGGGGGGGLPGLPVKHLQELGAKLQAHMDRTMGHVGAFITRFKEQHAKGRAPAATPNLAAVTAAATAVAAEGQHTLRDAAAAAAAAGSSARRKSMEALHSHEIRTSSGGDGGGGRSGGSGDGGDTGGGVGGGSGRDATLAGVNHAAAEAVMSLLESNGFAVVDNRRLSNYFWCKVSYEGQYHTSRLVPVAGGAVRWDETFVMAALRPARNAPLEIELYGSNDSKSRGKVVCQLSVPLCDLMDQVLRNHDRRVSELEIQREQHQQQAELQPRTRIQHLCSRLGNFPVIRQLKSAFASAASAGTAIMGGGAGAATSGSRLPPYHPDTWPRGRAVLKARIGGPGGHASATHGMPVGPDGGARECSFHFEVETVDADIRASANNIQLLPWVAPHTQHCHGQTHLQRLQGGLPAAAAAAVVTAAAADSAEATAGTVTPLHGAFVPPTRQGSSGSAVVVGADGGGGGDAVLTPPWSPVSRSSAVGAVDVFSPTGVGTGGVMSLGSIVAACFVHEAAAATTTTGVAAPPLPSSTPPPPLPLPPGEEEFWLPPRGLPHIRSHVADGARADAAVQRPSSPTMSVVGYNDLVDSPTAAAAGVMSLPATAPETGAPCTPNVRVIEQRLHAPDGSDTAATAVAATAAAAAPPPAGLCPAAALAASACATLSILCHDLDLERPQSSEAAVGGSGVAVGGQAAQHAAALAAITQGDYFVAIRCGTVWVTTNSLRVVGTGGGGGAAGGNNGGAARLTPHLGLVAPLLKPSALVSMALFRRTDVVAGKKVLNVRAMIGMMASEQLVGKLRFRASSLAPGRPVTVCLPLKAERSGPRPCATVAWCRMTLLLSLGPMGLARLVAAYAEPPTYPPIAMLQEGAVPGRGLSDTLPPQDPSKRVESEALKRRERRLVLKWVSESAPGLSANASRKLVEDGRTEFNAGRTTQNWRRIGRALSSTEPLKHFWYQVQSWNSPPLTLAVAAGEVALLIWPSRTIALLLLALMVWMVVRRTAAIRPPEEEEEGHDRLVEGHHHDGAAAAAAVAAAAADGADACGGIGGSDAGGKRGRTGASSAAPATVSYFGEPPLMVEDIGNEPDGAAATATAGAAGGNGRPGDGDANAPEPIGPIGGGSFTPGASSVQPSTPMAAHSSGLASVSASAVSSNPIPIPPSPMSTVSMTTTTTAAAAWIFGASPPSAPSGSTMASGEWAVHHHQQLLQRAGGSGSGGGGITAIGGGGGSEVPKDPLGSLRQQYDHMVYFGLRVQNVLDDIAGGMERLQALLSWRDPVASGCFALGLALTAVLLWTVGLRVVLGAVLLYDLRPPQWRDPWLPPPANAFAHLPTRADLMM